VTPWRLKVAGLATNQRATAVVAWRALTCGASNPPSLKFTRVPASAPDTSMDAQTIMTAQRQEPKRHVVFILNLNPGGVRSADEVSATNKVGRLIPPWAERGAPARGA
jgi:hypothetical protein